MSLTVKAYLFRGANTVGNPQSAEIRRFGIEEGHATNYSFLKGRVAAIFPNLVGQSLRLHWRDADGDYIVFSSDGELLDAISGLHDAVLKLYITSTNECTDDTDSTSASTGELHPSVTCDGCQGEVRGMRYKCLECMDYDLCKPCENKGIHAEHLMIRHVQPQHPEAQMMHHIMSRFGMAFGRGGGRGRGGRGRGCHFFRGHHGHHGRHQFGHGGCGVPEGTPEGAPTRDSGTETNPADAYLTTIGEQVAALLDPFGIDVQVDVERQDGQHHRCSTSTTSTTSTSSTSMETDDQKTSSATPAPAAGEEVADAIPMPDGDTVPLVRPVAPQPTSGQQTNEYRGPQFDATDASIGPQNSVVYPPQRLPNTDTRYNPIYPSIPVLRYPHVDPFERGLAPHVLVSLQQMKAMGFNNENGWLSALLSSKDGNLDSTLDSLKPNYQNYPTD